MNQVKSKLPNYRKLDIKCYELSELLNHHKLRHNILEHYIINESDPSFNHSLVTEYFKFVVELDTKSFDSSFLYDLNMRLFCELKRVQVQNNGKLCLIIYYENNRFTL